MMESPDQEQVHHFSHEHPLELQEIKIWEDIICFLCEKCCSGRTYVCCRRNCKYFLHDSCFILPQNICHPLHCHLLTLYAGKYLVYDREHSEKMCKICLRSWDGTLAYSCKDCQFHIHAECPVMISLIKYQGHCHNILFVDGQDPCQTAADDSDDPFGLSVETRALLCSACGTSCNTLTAMFHCIECDFHLHFQCGPLPCYIKHESHICSLKLTDSPVIVEGEDKDTDEFYCDTCEKKRDPRLSIYYCSDGCAYIAEIKCVLPEVLQSLRGEYGEVELRSTIFKHKTGKVICKGIKDTGQDNVTDGEVSHNSTVQEICNAFSRSQTRSPKFASSDNFDPNCCYTGKGSFSCYDEDYNKFMAFMDTYYYKEYIVGDFWINNIDKYGDEDGRYSYSFFPILQDLCAKYGDIIPKSTRESVGVSSFSVVVLCEIIKGMCTTRIADISEAKLFSWWRCLRALQSEGFNIEFVLDRLKRVADAYYALQVQETEKSELEEMDREIAKVSQDIDELEAKLVSQKAKLIGLKEIHKRREPSKPASSSKVAECFKEASVLKWMIAGDGLL